MTKRLQNIAIVFFSVFYLVLSIGIEVDLHYCLGELKDIKLFNHQETADNCCSDDICSLERAFTCCDNEHICYHLDDEQLSNNNNIKFNGSQYPALPSYASNKEYLAKPLKEALAHNIIFDQYPSPPVYLLNCSFI
ncbi:MAG: HYC_CC_PP family protein [Cyclobacteriaceae bacterium]